MLLILFHGVTGGFDELIIAVAAIGILWLAIKFAGRKPADEESDAEADDVAEAPAAAQINEQDEARSTR